MNDYGLIADHLYHRWTEKDVKEWYERAERMGAKPKINNMTLERLKEFELVPNTPLRERYEELLAKNESQTDIANSVIQYLEEKGACAQQFRHKKSNAMQECLGLKPQSSKNTITIRLWISYEMAEAFQKALNMTPREAGI